jgi:hypothetical protein
MQASFSLLGSGVSFSVRGNAHRRRCGATLGYSRLRHQWFSGRVSELTILVNRGRVRRRAATNQRKEARLIEPERQGRKILATEAPAADNQG